MTDPRLAVIDETTSPFDLGQLVSIRLTPAGPPLNREDAPELFDVILRGFRPAPPGSYGPYTPAEELLDRLNARARGEDPGDPINWKGPR